MTISNIDNLIVIIYFVFLFYIGLRYYSSELSFKYTENNTGKYKQLIIIATIFISSVGSGTTIGLMQKVFYQDMSYVYGILLAIIFDVYIGLKLIPKLVKHYGSLSAGDILGKHYGSFGQKISGFTSIIISIGYIAVQISVSGYIFEYILKINQLYGIILSYGIITTYASLGGFKAILYTNFVQFFGIILGIPLITYLLANNHQSNIDIYSYKYLPSAKILFSTIAVALNFSVSMLTPNFIQRTVISKDASILKKALMKKSLIYGLYVILIGINGLLFFAQYYDLNFENLPIDQISDQFKNIIPGVKGLIAVGLLAAATSTADSDLNIIAISLYHDLSLQKKISLRGIKFFTTILGTLSIVIALNFDNIIDIIMFSASFWAPLTFIPLVMTLHDQAISIKSFKINTILTILFCLTWQYFLPDNSIKPMFSGVVFNYILFAISHKIKTNHEHQN